MFRHLSFAEASLFSISAVPDRVMPAHHQWPWVLSFLFCQRQCLHRPKDQYSIERQKFLCRWTTSLEQSNQHCATAWHGLWTVQTTTEDIFVFLRQQHTATFFVFWCIVYTYTHVNISLIYNFHCEAKPCHTWRRNVSSLLITLGAVVFILPTPTSAPSQGPVLDWATEVSLSLDHKSGTV